MRVREIMTANPACCTPDTNLGEVARMMVENDCGCIPVVDSFSTMKPVGTITDRDITIRTVATNQNPLDLKASDIMTTNIVSITPEMSAEDCFDVMEDREIRRVLVVDERGSCCGIVAQADVAQIGVNPNRTAKMLREISESAPSKNRNMSFSARRSSSNNESFISSGSILPMLIGLGTGAALMYFLNSEQKSERRENINYTPRNYQPVVRHNVDTRNLNDISPDLSVNTGGIRTETRNSTTDNIRTSDEDDTFVAGSEKRRSATPGK